MTDAQKENQKKNLIKLNLMTESDTLVDCLQASLYERILGPLGTWQQGWIYFTDKAMVYPGGVLREHIVIPYKDITALAPCTQFLLPLGIAVTYKGADGAEKTQKFSMMGRGTWLAFLEEKRANA